MKQNALICCAILLIAGSINVFSADAQDWSGLRGNDGTGQIKANGILSRTSKVRLETRWKVAIGSGYSSVVVADDKVIAIYSGYRDGDEADGKKQDWMVCLSAEDGKRLWHYSLGPTFVGKNGSFDGALATPMVHEEKVFGLSATGRLFCVNLSDGKQVWAKDLQKEYKAPLPMYGFTTSPIVAGDSLVVQVGAEEMAVAGFDLKTGKEKWKTGTDTINSQTPFRAEVNGREIVLAFGGKKLLGVDPRNGEQVFSYEHGGGNGSAVTPVPIGKDRFLLTLDDSFSKAIKLQPSGDTINVSEEWKQRSIKNTYNVPVLVNDNVFGFSTRILTCVDPDTGKPRWRSRAPGDGFLIAVDDHLVVSTKKGSLHLVRANAEKYDELASAKIFKDLVWSIPAYHDNAVFVRSLGEIARVDIVGSATAVASETESSVPSGPKFAAFIEKLEAADSSKKSELIDGFFKDAGQMPFVEDDVVHFVYRGEGNDVAVASDIFGARQERKMKQVEGTDLFYYAVKLPRDQRANYVFLVDFKPQPDAKNNRMFVSSVYAGEMEFALRLRNEEPLKMSGFAMPDWKQPAYLPLPGEMAGKIESKEIKQEDSDGKTRIDVYLPESYESNSDKRYPVTFVFGAGARKQGKVDRIIDSIYQVQKKTGKAIAPESIVVFLSPNPMAPPNPGLLSKIVVPYLDKNYRTKAERTSRLCVGFGFDSASALMTAAANQELIGAVSVHSPMLFDAARGAVIGSMAKIDKPTKLYVEWGRYDMYNPHENWNVRTMSEAFVKDVKGNEHLKISGGMVNDGADWASWQNRIHQVLRLLED